MRETYSNELYHHGILGQKWGKKNGPPYPLGYSDHSAAEKKHLSRHQKKFAKATAKYNDNPHNLKARETMKKEASKDKDINEFAESIKSQAARNKIDSDILSGKYSSEEASKVIGSINYYKLKDLLNEDLNDDTDSMEVSDKTKEYVFEKLGIGRGFGNSQAASAIIDLASDKAVPADYSEVKKRVEERLAKKIDYLNSARNEMINEFKKEANDILITNRKILEKPENKKRSKEAADLGLKALHKMGMDTFYGYNKGKDFDDDDRSWFIYEDQTIGLHAIADLVNHGKSKEKILSLISKAFEIESLDLYLDDSSYVPGTFELAENSYWRTGDDKTISEFIDACIAVKKGTK